MDIVRHELSPHDTMIFTALGRLQGITQQGADEASRLMSEETFNALADVLVIVVPADQDDDFRFEYFGPKLQQVFGVDLTNATFQGLFVRQKIRKSLKDFCRVARRGTSMLTDVRSKPYFPAHYTRLLLPITQDGGVRQVIGAYALHEDGLPPVHPRRAFGRER